ncbi:MAG TPA: site-2 protease family protein [Pyrinomonadaceae bacterium]|nr:site-2 protease family protein [Pyrinomonadaceae bacterium]
MPDINIGQLIIYIVVLMLAFSAHEAAHAWMSYKFGDDTAYLLGRVSLNPVTHIHPIGSLLIPIVGFIFAAHGVVVPLIGWANPTPVNPLRWRNKDVANVMVSSAGIMANLLIAVIALVVIKALQWGGVFGGMSESLAEGAGMLLAMALSMNVSLAVFNLLPIPPLDGSKILYTFLPESARPALEALEQYGFLILMLLIYMGVLRVIFRPVGRVIEFLLML